MITLVTPSKNVTVWECNNTCYTIGNVTVLSVITPVTPSKNVAVFESDNACYAVKKRHGLGE